MADSVEAFIDAYVEALRDQNAAVFAGAGLSIPAGMVDWKELLREIATDVGLDVDLESADLVSLAQYHFNKFKRAKINQALIDSFADHAALTENHKILAALPIRTYWTTNYDTLIEDALKEAGKSPDVKITSENLATTKHRRDAVVYKMHGDVSLPHDAVITKEDYELYGRTRSLFSTTLQGDLVAKTFLFIGFSFSDPNLSYILGRIRSLLGDNQRQHFCLMRRVRRKDFKTQSKFDYARAKQDLQIEDLTRYGIRGVLVDDYKKYTDVLKRIGRRYRRSRVFISGSAADYTPWTEASGKSLTQEIARQLAQNGFGVVTGMGVGIGAEVVNGVLEQLNREKTRVVDDRLTMRAFPSGIVDVAERAARWREYREQMIAEAGVAIFLFGNKRNAADAIIPADGVVQEFEVAVEKDVAVVPVGCTGHVAARLHEKVLKRFSKHYPSKGYKKAFTQLGERANSATVVKRVIDFVKKVRDE